MFRQGMRVQRKHLPAFAGFQMPTAQNNQRTKMASFEWCFLLPFKVEAGGKQYTVVEPSSVWVCVLADEFNIQVMLGGPA